MAKSIGRVGILRNGTRVTVLEVTRVISKNPKIVVQSWHDRSGSGSQIYRLADGRVILAEFCQLTDETVVVPRSKKIVEPVEEVPEVDDFISDTTDESEEIAVAELTLPTFSSVAALEDAEVPEQSGEDDNDIFESKDTEEVEEEVEVVGD